MKNKRILITGATSGIGKEIAMELGAQGAELVLAVRDMKRGQAAAEAIRKRTGAKKVTVLRVDTSSQESIREFAKEFHRKFRRLDVLINNAGMNRGALGRETNSQGIELTFATNVLGYFLLTHELLDLLRASAPSRVVNVASQFASDVDLDDLQFERRKFEAVKAYAQSKACDRMLTWAMARRLKGSGVTANAMAPGLIVDTGLYRHSPPELVARLRQYSDRTVSQGADTAVWLATSDEVEGKTGKYYYDREQEACEFRNRAAEEKLWRICERMTGVEWGVEPSSG